MSVIRLCISVLGLASSVTAHAGITLSQAIPDGNIPALAEDEASVSEPSFEETSEKSYWIPALEIVGFDLLLNQFNRRFIDETDYDTSFSTIKDNLESSWRTDNNRFEINQIGHPYQGSIYHGFARSAGLNFWESFAYTAGGSAFWEIAGERTPPSRNDIITTSLAGPLLGESLFRMANLLLEQGSSTPGFWRELGASAISPPTGFNRYAFGDRFDHIFSSNGARYYTRLQLGISNPVESDRAASDDERTDGQIDFTLGYGLPGQPGYSYTRPFDHFVFQATASTANVVDNVTTRGLLLGKDYALGDNYRGIWGLYGTYDYIHPQTYRISSTALALGTTGQLWLSRNVALQGSVLGGVGYAAIGDVTNVGDDKDYHFDTIPQGLLALRMIYGNKASLDYTLRAYSIHDHKSRLNIDEDKITRTDLALTFRVKGPHGISVRYQWNERDVDHAGPGDLSRSIESIGIFYTFLGKDGFGATEWR
jgi:hypothetical protein